MKEPGELTLQIARKLCRRRSAERVVAAAVADLRHEWGAARAAGARGRAAWIRMTGSVRIAQALLMQGAIDAWGSPEPTGEPGEPRLADLLGWTLVSLFLLWITLMLPGALRPLAGLDVAERAALVPYLLPAFAAAFLPMSLLPGALLALRRAEREPSPRVVHRLLVAASVAGVISLVFSAWITPAANLRYIELLRVSAPHLNLPAEMGPRQQTIGELSRRIGELEGGEAGAWLLVQYRIERHKRFALPAACLPFALLAIGLKRRGVARSVASSFLAGVAVLVAYFFLLRFGEQAGGLRAVPAPVGAWLADFVLALVSMALLARRPRAEPADRLPVA